VQRAGYEGIAFICPSVPGQRKARKEDTNEEPTNEHTNLIPDNFYALAARRILGPKNLEKRRRVEMNATMVASGTKAVPPSVSSIQDIPIAKIRESKTNPRRFFDEAKLAELADNIRQHGVLQPIFLRPLPEGETSTYELVAGTRRYRATKLAKRESIPATVRELTDAQALELQVIENEQRVDVHPLDEAQGYAALIELQPDTYTVESIASRVGRSPAYVNGRLRLIQLIPEAKQAFYEDKLTVAHAFEIARLQRLCCGVSYVAQSAAGPLSPAVDVI
jgi:ParB/RepB/Spo0J family partition protein